ncbi:MAG: hypothetical protein JWO95_3013, partial [Verrucomicrobiales bacterium]|nr:hypothetical protein [Verrucomicrobiales bacterium]
MTLSQAANALVVASKIGRMALEGVENPKQAGSVSRCQTMPSVSAPPAVATSAPVPQPAATPAVDSTDLKFAPVGKDEKVFLITESAEKCVPEFTLCPSRRSRSRRRNSIRAIKCQKVPFRHISGIPQNQNCTVSASFLPRSCLAPFARHPKAWSFQALRRFRTLRFHRAKFRKIHFQWPEVAFSGFQWPVVI